MAMVMVATAIVIMIIVAVSTIVVILDILSTAAVTTTWIMGNGTASRLTGVRPGTAGMNRTGDGDATIRVIAITAGNMILRFGTVKK